MRGAGKAFTLAEILITLAIVGVVAAITLPGIITRHDKQTNLTSLKRAYSDLHQYIKMFDYDNDCNSKLLNCAYTPPTGEPVFVTMFSQYLIEKQNFQLVKNSKGNGCVRIPVRGTGSVFDPNLPYITSCPVGSSGGAKHFLISPTGTYAYYIQKYTHDNFYSAPNNRGTFRAIISIFTNPKHFKACQLNCTQTEKANASLLGRNIFHTFITDTEYIMPQGSPECYGKDYYYCKKLDKTNCSNTKKDACIQKIIQDGWKISDDYPW